MNIPNEYIDRVKQRTLFRYYMGGVIRLIKYLKFAMIRQVAIYNGAIIGKNTNLTWKIAKNANKNLIIGDDCVIEAQHFDLRGGRIIIHDHVIINKEVSIIRVSHKIDDDRFFTTRHFPDLQIESYTWLATGCKILPQVTRIEEGCICGAYSVIAKNCESFGVYAGNPAKQIRKHDTPFDQLVVCSLQGGDYNIYIYARNL